MTNNILLGLANLLVHVAESSFAYPTATVYSFSNEVMQPLICFSLRVTTRANPTRFAAVLTAFAILDIASTYIMCRSDPQRQFYSIRTSSNPDVDGRCKSVKANPGKDGITRSRSLNDNEVGLRGKKPAHDLIPSSS